MVRLALHASNHAEHSRSTLRRSRKEKLSDYRNHIVVDSDYFDRRGFTLMELQQVMGICAYRRFDTFAGRFSHLGFGRRPAAFQEFRAGH